MKTKYTFLDERSLLVLMKQVDEEGAFQELFFRYQNRIYRYALRIIHSPEVAEEILQDVFLKVWNYRNKIDEDRQFSSLLFKMARNTILNSLKSQKTHAELTEQTIETLISYMCPENEMIWKQYVEILNEALTKLPERCREIFKKSRFEGLSYDEIAEDLGISKNTVRLQIVKSLKILREFLTAHPEIDSTLIKVAQQTGTTAVAVLVYVLIKA